MLAVQWARATDFNLWSTDHQWSADICLVVRAKGYFFIL